MILIAVLALAGFQNQVLKCHHDGHGKLVVTKQQWEYIHGELDAWKSARTLPLVHPTRGVKVRIVDTAHPRPDGSLFVWRGRWTRAELKPMLDKSMKPTYDINYPGYTYEAIGHLSPNPKQVENGTPVMKGDMLYLDEPPSPYKDEPRNRKFFKEVNRLSPLIYIRMFCEKGRLWLYEVSSDSLAE